VARLGKTLYDKKGKAKQIQPPKDNTTAGVNKPVEGETVVCRLCHKEGVGVSFVTEGPVRRNTFGRSTQKQCRSYDPRSFDIVTRLETKGCTDLKMKRPIGP
jgi:hypothetical protein